MAIKSRDLALRLSPSLRTELREMYFKHEADGGRKDAHAALKDEFWRIASEMVPRVGTTLPGSIWIKEGGPMGSMHFSRGGGVLGISEKMEHVSQAAKEAVVAHELGHKKHRDGAMRTNLYETLSMAGTFAASISTVATLYFGAGERAIAEMVGGASVSFAGADALWLTEAVAVGAFVGYVSRKAVNPVIMLVNRRQELRADIAALNATGSASGMVGGFFMECISATDTQLALRKILRIGTDDEGTEVTARRGAAGVLERMFEWATVAAGRTFAETAYDYMSRLNRWYGWVNSATHPSTMERIRNVLEYAARHGMER